MDKLKKIRWHHWKERLKTSKIAKFEIDTSLASENIAPESWENSDVCKVGGKFIVPLTIQRSVTFRDFEVQ